MSLKQLERFVRRTRDRVLKRPFPDINHLLHHARGECFKQAPKGVQNLVSVGCSGTWYFKWIHDTYGPVAKHTGVEFYSPKPDDLPVNAEWIANTAGNMPEIPSESAEGVFSGQNLEHLWPEDACGFYLESHRILKPGGLLIVDSPNRLITARYNWSHPEHTVELTPDEAVELTTLAGFDVTNVKGLWLCESPISLKLYPFSKMRRYGSASVHRRISEALDQPDHSFLWWVEARRARRAPDAAALRSRMNQIWDIAWPARCQRTLTIIGQVQATGNVFRSTGRAGVLMYGPYLPLRTGTYTATFQLELLQPVAKSDASVRCEVIGRDGSLVLTTKNICLNDLDSSLHLQPIQLSFSIQDTTFGVQFRVIIPDNISIQVARSVELATLDRW